jgi:hypothetical protein
VIGFTTQNKGINSVFRWLEGKIEAKLGEKFCLDLGIEERGIKVLGRKQRMYKGIVNL